MVKKFYRKFQNYIVPSNIKHNFLDLTHQNRELISKKIKEVYIPTISNHISNDKLLSEIEEHVEERIFIDRVRVVPWIMKHINLKNLEILEIGCGTGSSSITLAEQGAKVLGIDVHLESLEVARLRSKIYNLNINFLELPAVDIDSLEKNLIQLFYMRL